MILLKCTVLRREQTLLKGHFKKKGNLPTDSCGLGSDLDELKNAAMTPGRNVRLVQDLHCSTKGANSYRKWHIPARRVLSQLTGRV